MLANSCDQKVRVIMLQEQKEVNLIMMMIKLITTRKVILQILKQQMNKVYYGMFPEERSLVLGWAGMMGIIVMCYLLK